MNPRQAIFIAEYEVDFNATRAAIAAGFAPKSAEVAGSRLLRRRDVQAILAERQARRVEKLDISVERTARELAKLAYFDPGRLFDDKGRVKKIAELDEVTRAAVEGFDVDPSTGKVTRIVLAKKGQNLERMMRYLGMMTDRVQHSGTLTLEQLVCGSGADEAG